MIGSVTKRIENLKQDKLSGESIYKILLQFDKVMMDSDLTAIWV